MLEYQQNKARRFALAKYDHRPAMATRSREVRGLLEDVQPISDRARVLEVGSGAHGLIFFFGVERGIGIDPLAHHYATLFPAWQRQVATVSATGEALPFPDHSFEIVLSDNVVDHAENPSTILAEIARVLAPGGVLYFTVNISHVIYGWFSTIYGLCRALGVPVEVKGFADHTVHLPLREARRLLTSQSLRIVWETHSISATRMAMRRRRVRRLRAWVQSVFYHNAYFQAIAVRR